jgi:hypothetical protein
MKLRGVECDPNHGQPNNEEKKTQTYPFLMALLTWASKWFPGVSL